MTSSEKLDSLIASKQLEEAFSLLVKDESELLLRSIYRWVKEESSAQDVLQNAFIKIWKGLPNFRGDSKLLSWCYRIAYNESMSHLRSKRHLFVIDIQQEENHAGTSQSDGHSGDQISLLLQEAIDTLPERQRQVFELRYFEEMSYEAIAERLDLSTGALKASFHHAKKKIEAHLRKQF